MTFVSGIQRAVQLVYPARCLTCGDIVDSDFGLCGHCWRDTSFIGGTICDGCGAPLPGIASDDALHCDDCLRTPRPWDHGRSALSYCDIGRKLVLALKHGDRQEIARPSSRWMAEAVRDILLPDTLVVPIPLHWRRMLARRFNQSALLARGLAEHVQRPACLDLLQRFKHTQSLDGKSREERYDTVSGAIRVNPKREHLVDGRSVLLVDDVFTSGATFSAATNALYEAGAGSVCVVALARVGKDT